MEESGLQCPQEVVELKTWLSTHTHKRFRSTSDQFIEFSERYRNSLYQGGRRMKNKGSLGSMSRWSRKDKMCAHIAEWDESSCSPGFQAFLSTEWIQRTTDQSSVVLKTNEYLYKILKGKRAWVLHGTTQGRLQKRTPLPICLSGSRSLGDGWKLLPF